MRGIKGYLAAVILCSLFLTIGGCRTEAARPEQEADTEMTEKIAEEAEESELQQEEPEEEIPDDGRFHGTYLVDTDYVKERIGAADVLFIDSRGWQQAALGTIKGAIALTWQDLCITEGKAGDEAWGRIPEAEDLSERLSEFGITMEKEIIVIGETDSGWGDDARIVWQLLAAGYPDVKMIDGGYAAAKAAGVKTQLFASKAGPAKVSIDQIDETHVMTTAELLDNYSAYQLVDVRTKEEYNGAVLHNEEKGGHMPAAVHLPYTGLFQEDGTLKPNKEIIRMCEAAGIKKEDHIVTYCTGGIRSAYTQLVLEMCGYKYTWNYDQSYWRWCKVGKVE